MLPVVQPRALETAVGHREAERLDEVERAAGDGAGAGDVASVLGDLRLEKYDVDLTHVGVFLFQSKWDLHTL